MFAFIIVWSGLGCLVPIIIMGCFVAVGFAFSAITGDDPLGEEHRWPFLIGGLIAAPMLWLFGNALHKNDDASSFFFIPVRWWAILAPLLGFWVWCVPAESEPAPEVQVLEPSAAPRAGNHQFSETPPAVDKRHLLDIDDESDRGATGIRLNLPSRRDEE